MVELSAPMPDDEGWAQLAESLDTLGFLCAPIMAVLVIVSFDQTKSSDIMKVLEKK